MRPTLATIRAAGWDAGNRSMQAAGRVAWDEADWNAAADSVKRLIAAQGDGSRAALVYGEAVGQTLH